MKKLLVVIPALNEEKNIGRVIRGVPGKIPGVSKIEVLVVDDGSKDKTEKVVTDQGAQIIKHPQNLGLGVAFDTGLQFALDNKFDLMVFIDGDGQFNPVDIPKLVSPILNKEADFVTASRFIDKRFHPKIQITKFWGNKLIAYLVSSLTGKKFYDVSCGFRAYSRQAMMALNLQGEFTYTHEVFLDLAFRNLRIMEIPIKVKYFSSRRSRMASNLISYGARTIKIIFRTYRDYKPLRFFFGIGSFFLTGAVLFEAILLWTFITKNSFTPNIWAGFVGAVFLFMAIVFCIVGVLADMNTRIRRNQEKILTYLKKAAYDKRD